MAYLQRINYHPVQDNLTDAEKQYLKQRFAAYGTEIVVNGEAVPWQFIETVEVAKAARTSGLAGWLVKNMVMNGDRYHIGIYYGNHEVVFTNATLNTAAFILKNIAYYAPGPVQYKGPDDLVPLTDV
ncbi:MAG TPA: hypothetical protein VHL11_14480 [Phototrophicaceae bacterium]|jgi:hypothetical protein|nr:hypothetical protein [Phototrophicaceae bacterium]